MYVVEVSIRIYCTVFWPEAKMGNIWYSCWESCAGLQNACPQPCSRRHWTMFLWSVLAEWVSLLHPWSLTLCASWELRWLGAKWWPRWQRPTVIRDKDTYLQPKPRDRRRRGCGDGEGQTGVGGWTRGERGESRVIEWEDCKMNEGRGKPESRSALSCETLRTCTRGYRGSPRGAPVRHESRLEKSGKL